MNRRTTSRPVQVIAVGILAALVAGCGSLLAQRSGNAPANAAPVDTGERQARMVRGFMSSRGIRDSETQEVVVATVAEQTQARQELLQAGRELMHELSAHSGVSSSSGTSVNSAAAPKSTATQDKGQGAGDQTAAAVQRYETAVAGYQAQRAKAIASLEAKTGFSKKSRLRGILLLLGVIEDAPPVIPVGGSFYTGASPSTH